MADCSKTVDFLREWKRMCDNKVFSELCTCCPMNYKGTGHADMTCSMYARAYPDDAIAIVQKWSDEHPVKTWISELMDRCPNADKVAMIVGACPGWVFGTGPNVHHTDCGGRLERKCGECWEGEYKEATNNAT